MSDTIERIKKTEELRATLEKQLQTQNILEEDTIEIEDPTLASIDEKMDQIFDDIDEYAELPNSNSPEAQQLASKINTQIDAVKPLIEEIEDPNLLQECIDIQAILQD